MQIRINDALVRERSTRSAISMTLSPLLADVFVPAVVLLEYGLVKMQSTPLREALWGGLIGGVVFAIVLWFGEPLLLQAIPQPAPGASQPFITPFVASAGIEQGCALIFLVWLLRAVVKFADTRDAVLGSLGWSIGFATMNLLILVSWFFAAKVAAGTGAMPVRSLPLMFEHGVCGLIMGVLLGRACRSITISLWWLSLAFALPVAIQAVLDALVSVNAGHRTSAIAAALLPTIFAAATLLAVSLCRPPPPRQVVMRARRKTAPPRSAWLSGALMVILGVALVAITVLPGAEAMKQAFLLRCIVPLLFGIDLLVGGIRQGAARTA